MRRGEEIRKAARTYAMIKSKEKNTFFVDYKDIEKAFLDGALFAYTYSVTSNNKERRTNHGSHIKFYVARDMNGTIWLYMCKPKRAAGSFVSSEHGLTLPSGDFSKYGLDANDYANLKWEDDPLEVFLNMED